MATLKERDPEEYAALCTLYSGATDRINDPDYERVQPPPPWVRAVRSNRYAI